MRNFLTILVLSLMAFVSANAQSEQQTTKEVYCMIVGTQKFMSSKITITIDYGQETKYSDGARKMKVVDDDGNVQKFNSLMDACNYISSKGWLFVSAYPMDDNKQGTCYHYIFRKTIPVDSNVEFRTRGNTGKQKEKEVVNDDVY